MSMQIQYSAAGLGGSKTVNSAADTVFQYFQQAIRRRAERSKLHTMHARLCAVSVHTFRDIDVDRDGSISVPGAETSGLGVDTGLRGRANGGD